jgi:hypothetical protein
MSLKSMKQYSTLKYALWHSYIASSALILCEGSTNVMIFEKLVVVRGMDSGLVVS